ncbi:P2X purinoceptor 3a [Ictalurus furcatus]|uniref:P2X purinoceptor 3a n=1 Tax=Ictalurus furcatus TaxID=66913 RepID=UPI0023507BCF|nr:P2X purinoceptor 3a [Ictalurus furcatus]
MFGWIGGFFTYETTKSVVVKSWSVGIINRVAQLLIIIYFVGWVFLHEKAYQVRDTGIESSVMTKVKGFGFLNSHLMDVADYVMPTQGSSMFCVITAMFITANQTQRKCPETDKNYNCTTDKHCEKHHSTNLASGKITGKCITEVERCEILGWCPAEDDHQDITPMSEAENFTIFIKNSIRFPLFNVTRGNMGENTNLSCFFDPINNTDCPIFRLADVLKYAGENFTNISRKGGEIGINIAWMCNLDQHVDNCKPKYTFTRLDSAFKNSNTTKGYNFRFAKYFKAEDGSEYRTLHKAFAIRFDILVSGNAGKFHLIPTVINVVAACTSVGLATVLCDIILLNFLKGAKQYKAKKFEEVSDSVSRSPSFDHHQGSQMTIKREEKSSDDSGAYSIRHQM